MVSTTTAMMAITMTTAATMMTMFVTFAMMIVTTTTAVFVAIAFFISMIVPATTTSAAAFATDMVQHLLHFFVRSLAVLNNFALKQQVKPCKRMVQVHLHRVFRHINHTTHKAVSVFVLQRNNGIFVDVVVVEVAIDGEYLLVQVDNALVKTFAISLFAFDVQRKLLALRQVFHTIFKSVEGDAKARNKHKRAVGRRLFDKRFLAVGQRIKLISHGDKLVVFFFHCHISFLSFPCNNDANARYATNSTPHKRGISCKVTKNFPYIWPIPQIPCHLTLLRSRVVLYSLTVSFGIFRLHFQLYSSQSPFKE